VRRAPLCAAADLGEDGVGDALALGMDDAVLYYVSVSLFAVCSEVHLYVSLSDSLDGLARH